MILPFLSEYTSGRFVSSSHQRKIEANFSGVCDSSCDRNYSEVFATASKDDIRVWHTETCKELLRISVPNFTCSTVKFSADGKSIISGK